MLTSYLHIPTQQIRVDGRQIAYRHFGTQGKTPILYLNHLAANLDGCDPQLMDALAKDFPVISFDYPGIGASEGSCAPTVAEMARQTIAFVRALKLDRVHLLGLSLGGFVAQELLLQAPELVQSVILAGTGPAGDRGIGRVPRITYYDMLRGALTGRDPRYYLFFPTLPPAREQAQRFLARTQQRQERDEAVTLSALLGQLRAVRAWATTPAQDFSHIRQRVWVVNGDHDRMVPTAGSYVLQERFPLASLTIYEGAGHGAIFQEVDRFTQQATIFYSANEPQA